MTLDPALTLLSGCSRASRCNTAAMQLSLRSWTSGESAGGGVLTAAFGTSHLVAVTSHLQGKEV